MREHMEIVLEPASLRALSAVVDPEGPAPALAPQSERAQRHRPHHHHRNVLQLPHINRRGVGLLSLWSAFDGGRKRLGIREGESERCLRSHKLHVI